MQCDEEVQRLTWFGQVLSAETSVSFMELSKVPVVGGGKGLGEVMDMLQGSGTDVLPLQDDQVFE